MCDHQLVAGKAWTQYCAKPGAHCLETCDFLCNGCWMQACFCCGLGLPPHHSDSKVQHAGHSHALWDPLLQLCHVNLMLSLLCTGYRLSFCVLSFKIFKSIFPWAYSNALCIAATIIPSTDQYFGVSVAYVCVRFLTKNLRHILNLLPPEVFCFM